MDAALVGLLGTSIGAVTGFGGAWLAQRGQLRLFREQRSYESEVRWVNEKRELYRDLLMAMYGWRDALISIWRDEGSDALFDTRDEAIKLSLEVALIARFPARTAVQEAHAALLMAQLGILPRAQRTPGPPPLGDVWRKLTAMEEALRSELMQV
ncbi:hypothetical protein AB0H82_01580 [Streptomyces sp. NPDC050732]|uniref:hypothetical protein n=1 Tax=Streptomyces sp. NPDC050732 TaxID=3154632 RepID=UPI003426C171